MSKYFFSIIVLIFIFIYIFCGCLAGEQKTDSDILIGTWKSEDSEYKMYKFFEDGTCLINTYELKGTYHINKDGHLVINQTENSITYVYEYSINYNKDKLTLTNIETYEHNVFIKQ